MNSPHRQQKSFQRLFFRSSHILYIKIKYNSITEARERCTHMYIVVWWGKVKCFMAEINYPRMDEELFAFGVSQTTKRASEREKPCQSSKLERIKWIFFFSTAATAHGNIISIAFYGEFCKMFCAVVLASLTILQATTNICILAAIVRIVSFFLFECGNLSSLSRLSKSHH